MALILGLYMIVSKNVAIHVGAMSDDIIKVRTLTFSNRWAPELQSEVA